MTMGKKIIAFYLPCNFMKYQKMIYGGGKGFTDWVSTKKAKLMFIGHNQPRIPYKYNYYNLLSKSTIKWQINLAKKIWNLWFLHISLLVWKWKSVIRKTSRKSFEMEKNWI